MATDERQRHLNHFGLERVNSRDFSAPTDAPPLAGKTHRPDTALLHTTGPLLLYLGADRRQSLSAALACFLDSSCRLAANQLRVVAY